MCQDVPSVTVHVICEFDQFSCGSKISYSLCTIYCVGLNVNPGLFTIGRLHFSIYAVFSNVGGDRSGMICVVVEIVIFIIVYHGQ